MNYSIPESVDFLIRDCNDLLGSGKYHVTEEIADEVKAILDGIRKFKLESTLMPTQPEALREFEGNFQFCP
jgi:hypothetical protein